MAQRSEMEYELGKAEWIDAARSFVVDLGLAHTDDALRSLASDATLRVLGHHSLSGSFAGRDAVAAHLATVIARTDGRLDPVKFEDWMLGLSHVAVLVDVHVEVGAVAQRLRHLIVLRFGLDDLVDEVTVFFADPDVAERVYGHRLGDGSPRRDG